MSRIKTIARQRPVQAALSAFEAQRQEIVNLAIAVQQIPAPTFAEGARADYIEAKFRSLGLDDVGQDDLHNVYGRYAGTNPSLPPVVVSAHNDTVFAADTDLTVKRSNGHVYGPGIGDNSTGVAGLFALLSALKTHHLRPPADIWLVSNSGEEGLGDLRGMRAVVERFGRDATYIVVEGGLFGQISHQAIGVRRFRLTVTTPGGHSWGSFGTPSAIHILSQAVAQITRLSVSSSPKTTYNVGVIEGGTSINTIAAEASFLLDLRSEEPSALATLEKAVRQIVRRLQAKQPSGVALSLSLIGDRPAGQLAANVPLVRWAREALQAVGCRQPNFIASSTDANIPLSQGITAVCVGLTESGNAHRLDEYMDPARLPDGMGQLLLLVLAAAGYMNNPS